jgi:hypothetical protein
METNLFIPVDKLKHRAVYALRSRNLLVGVWDENSKGFIGVREKMGDIYLFTEYHYDLGGTANAIEELPLNLPEDVELRENFDPTCREHLQYVVFTTPIAKGGEGWIHVNTKERCDGVKASAMNHRLFDLLEPIHVEILRKENQHNELSF